VSRLAARFEALQEAKRTGLICYAMAGDPGGALSPAVMHALVAGGADVVELGMPFSEPSADGPVIQAAAERALKNGTRLTDVIAGVSTFRERDTVTPVVLMGYLNPIERMGYTRFVEAAAAAGVDGILIVDMPPEESKALVEPLAEADIDPIFLVAPTTSAARMRCIAKVARGFLYYVSLKGVTGAATLDTAAVGDRVTALRRATQLPIAVGFGIRDAAAAARLRGVADAVVVGSAIVKRIAENSNDERTLAGSVREFVAELSAALGARASGPHAGGTPALHPPKPTRS
jgi:tryptophan synthase alpha chain